jgi:steroid 5-alpha reductase family enzyme
LAARTHSYTASSRGAVSDERRSNHRATLALLCGVIAVVAIPLAIYLTRRVSEVVLLDAAWAIPVAALAAVAALVVERRLLAVRVLAVTGICLTLSSALAVGIYEFLLWKEHH